MGEQIAPRLTRREVAARQRHRRQTAEMLALAIVDPQALAAPQRAVFPHPDTVEDQGNHVAALPRPAVLGQAGGGVGMMMQHAVHRQHKRRRPPRSAVAGMGVGNHPLRGKSVNLLHQTQRLPPLRLDALLIEIAKMLAEHRFIAAQQAERIFHIRAESQQRRYVVETRRQRQRVRHVAAGTAQHLAALPHHGIIHPLHNLAIMQQKTVGNSG